MNFKVAKYIAKKTGHEKKQLAITSLVLLFSSCDDKSKTEVKDILPKYEVIGKDKGNRIDQNGLKQVYWMSYEQPGVM